jgi:pyruvate dehydrogenase E1 component
VSDFMRAVQDQIAPWVPGSFSSLGTDGFGLSDTRGALRRHFKVDAASIATKVLGELAKRGDIKPEAMREAIERYQLADVNAAPTAETEGGAE